MNKSRSYALMIVGGILMAIGLGVVLVGCSSDISVETIQGQRVSNLSKMQEQSIAINIGLVITVIGIGLLVTGVVINPSSSMQPCPHCGNGVKQGFSKCSSCRSEIAWIEGYPIKPEDNQLRLNELRDAAYKLLQQKYKEGKYDEALRGVHHYTSVLKSQNQNDAKLDQAILKCRAMAAQSAFQDMKQLIAKSMYRDALSRTNAHRNEILKDSAIAGEYRALSTKCEKQVTANETRHSLIIGSIFVLFMITAVGWFSFLERQAKIAKQKEAIAKQKDAAEREENARAVTAERNRIIQSSPFTNSINMSMKLLPPGNFSMGWTHFDYRVVLSKPFCIGVHEVTQEQYEKVVGSNPSYKKGPQNPVTNVSWEDAVAFCQRLSELPAEKAANRVYRLPTEAEWEYACRAGTASRYFFGDDDDPAVLGEYCWYKANSRNETHPVGQKKPNPWSLHDVYGNVEEWCSDWYLEEYPKGVATDPQGPNNGRTKVFRGETFITETVTFIDSITRFNDSPVRKTHFTGFRVVMTSSQTP